MLPRTAGVCVVRISTLVFVLFAVVSLIAFSFGAGRWHGFKIGSHIADQQLAQRDANLDIAVDTLAAAYNAYGACDRLAQYLGKDARIPTLVTAKKPMFVAKRKTKEKPCHNCGGN